MIDIRRLCDWVFVFAAFVSGPAGRGTLGVIVSTLVSTVAFAQTSAPGAISILVGFGPAQGNDQPARPETSALTSARVSPDMTYDQTARFLARNLGRLLPGGPAVQAQQVAGGAGLVAARRLLAAKPDGSTIALLSANVIFGAALRLEGRDFPIERVVWLGAVAPDAWACLRTAASQGRETPWAGSLGTGTRSDVHLRAMRDLASYPLRIASGYASRFELVRAIENGEIDMACGWPIADLQRRSAAWLESGKVEIIATFGRRQYIPNPSSFPASSATAIALLSAEGDFSWPIAAPPSTPPAVALDFRTALAALGRDPAALEEAAQAGVNLDPVDAILLERHVNDLVTLKDDTRTKLLELFQPQAR